MPGKLEYIARMFSRAQNKVYENYVVTSIYHRINNFDLKPVTQQKVISSKDPTKYYLLDLYFPQINYGIEIDEPAHSHPAYQLHDIQRAEDVFASIKCKERVVKIETNDLQDVNRQIEAIVKEIRELLKKKTVKWVDNAQMLKEVYSRKKLKADENIDYGNFSKIWEGITGEKLTHNRRCYFKNKLLPGDYHLWVPYLAINVNGTILGNSGWNNTLNKDMDEIVEKGDLSKKRGFNPGPVSNGEKRVVFMHMKDEFGKNAVKFIGVFQTVEYPDENTARYVRIKKEYSW